MKITPKTLLCRMRNKQGGAVLVTSLLFLVVLTLLGVSSMQSNVMEERMSGNLRDRNIAFQAAEAGLHDAEAFVEGIVSVAAFNGTLGLYGEDDVEPDFFSSANWAAASSKSYAGAAINGVQTQPRYIIKFIGEVTTGGGAEGPIGNYGDAKGTTIKRFRLTARGTGGSDDSIVILQNHYAREF
ncbi:PilX N-terminal domain-containing pilus assembly protein [Pseudomonadota bacterium]